jgi:hypothetical protein
MVVGNGAVVGVKNEGLKVEDVVKLLRELRSGVEQTSVNPTLTQMVAVQLQMVEKELEKPKPDKLTVGVLLQGVVGTLTTLAAGSEAVQKLLPLAQRAGEWIQQVVK